MAERLMASFHGFFVHPTTASPRYLGFRSLRALSYIPVVLLMTAPSLAATKNDIRGLTLGLAYEDAKNNCKRLGTVNSSRADCTIEDGVISLNFTQGLEPNLVKQISYLFESGAGPNDLTAHISQEFRASPKPDCSATVRSAAFIIEHNRTRNRRLEQVTDLICTWMLDEDAILELRFSRIGGNATRYDLILKTNKFNFYEGQAKMQREMKLREINPKPKF